MRKFLSIILAAIMGFSIMPVSVFAETSGDFEYKILDDGTAEITDYTGNATALDIPSTIDGYTVTSIGYEAFYGCDSLTSITIPGNVTSIHYGAFEFSNNAFYYCSRLESITVDEKNKYYSSDEYGVLFNKDRTNLIQYPIGNSRTEYTIPDSVTSIGNYAFSGCSRLESVVIGNGVTSIGAWAFYDCNSLESVTIGNGVTSIWRRAFYNTAIYNNPDNWIDGVLYIDNCLIEADSETLPTEYTIPDSIICISDEAFDRCSSLESVTIGNSITSIGNNAFCDCSNLKSVTIGNSVISIGYYAFLYCRSLESVTIPDSVMFIGFGAFHSTAIYNNPDNWIDGVLYIDNCLIEADSETLPTEYTISDGARLIADDAFSYCNSLENITIPDSVMFIGFGAFDGCRSLTDVYYSGSEEEWNNINIGSGNDDLTNATIHFGKADTEVQPEKPSTEPEKPSSEPTTQPSVNKDLAPKSGSDIKVSGNIATIKAGQSVKDIKSQLSNENVKIVDKDNKEITGSTLLGTGSKIQVLDNSGKVLSAYTVLVPMDVNGDGKITAADARTALRVSANLVKLEGVFLTAANTNDDNKITASDARKILRVSANLEKA